MMKGSTFLRRGLWHYRGAYVGVFLAAVLGAVVLLGAMFAGDSVKGTLKRIAEMRLGKVGFVFTGGDRFFRDELAREVGGAAPVLLLKGQVSARNGERASGGVQVLGVDDAFWQFAPEAGGVGLAEKGVGLNRELAERLGVAVGDTVVLRLQKPGLFSRDAPLSGEGDELLSLRGEVSVVLGDEQFGSFSLQASQLPEASVFVPLARLQEAVGFPGKVNVMLLNDSWQDRAAEIHKKMKLVDFGLSAIEIPLAGATELRTERIFLDPYVVTSVERAYPEAEPVLTYLAKTIAAGERETPYSMVTAVGSAAAPFLPEELAADGIVLNDWEAEDLQAQVGDELRLDFWKAGRGGRLEDASATLKVAAIVPMVGLVADRLWMPDFPGVADAEKSSDWSPGMPIDLTRIREKDETYWDDFRGTPKAFIGIGTGRELWGNRWGDCTALRLPGKRVADLEERLPALLDPAKVGLVVSDVRAAAVAAASSPVDIAGLFLSMSIFLIVAAVALVALLFRFNVELRNQESGLLSALGIPAKRVMRWRLGEALVVVVAGSVVAVPLAVLFTLGILRFLETIWSTGGGMFAFEMSPATVVGGLVGYVVMVMAVVGWVTRKQAKRSAGLRLEEGVEEPAKLPGKRSAIGAMVCLLIGIGAMGAGPVMGPQGAFFLAGAALLAAGLLMHRRHLGAVAMQRRGGLSVEGLARLNAARRPSRTGVVVGILACGVFLVVSVAAFRKGTGDDWAVRASGSGGYALWVETSGPINRSADAGEEEDWLELGEDRGKAGAILPVRVGEGDDASCFNLNSVAQPRLLALEAGVLAERDAFEIKKVAEGLEESWSVLGDGETLRAFVDETTLMWALKMKLGDRIAYRDERGNEFEVEIVGTLADSVFQGNLIVDEEAFLARYPSQEGYGVFLVEAAGEVEALQAEVGKTLADRGAEVMMTTSRLEAFHGVENTYLAIFHVLGGLGVLLGSAGLGLVTARNLSERRYEFAVMRTVGIPQAVTRRMVFREAASSIAWGLGIGVVAAVVSIAPNLVGDGFFRAMGWVVLLGMLVAGAAWFWAWMGYRGIVKRVTGVVGEF